MRLVALLTLGLCACEDAPQCTSDIDCTQVAECEDGCHCADDRCIPGMRACGATAGSCPDGYQCCSGSCSLTSCCIADYECTDGHCSAGHCVSGERPDCNDGDGCKDSPCLITTGRCIECIHTDDCDNPELYCSPDHACVPLGNRCTAASCAVLGLICGAEGDCRGCVRAAECGDRVCVEGICRACAGGSNCGLGRHCDTGVCMHDPELECTANADCGSRVCSERVCQSCTRGPECGTGRTCDTLIGICQAQIPNCQNDSDCAPPQTVCVAGLCSTGCAPRGCGRGQVCSPTTGRCVVISSGELPLGATCTHHNACASGVCWVAVDETGDPFTWCSRACSRHDDCPDDFICGELGDGRACMAKSHFPLPLDTPPGGNCVGSFQSGDCMTGYCNPNAGECMQTCGRDADCADMPVSSTCVSRWQVAVDENSDEIITADEILGFTQLCHPALPTDTAAACDPDVRISGVGLEAGARCDCHDDCQHGYCALTPDYSLEPRCAEPCCTPNDCEPSRPVCKPLSVWDGLYDNPDEPYGFQKVCLWREYEGTKLAGEVCADDSDCRSEMCVTAPSGTKMCTHACCTDRDCASFGGAATCRTPFRQTDPPHLLADTNLEEIEFATGRWAITNGGLYRTSAITTVCLPK